MAAPDEPPIAWPDHPLAASGGEILASRILPLMGHNARDFARAAAVCRGWRPAARAAAATLNVYRETALKLSDVEPENEDIALKWSPCGKFIAAAVPETCRLSIFRASTGALANAWDLATPATNVPKGFLAARINVTFSHDGTRVLTLFEDKNHFSLWSVPEGQLLAVHRGDPDGLFYHCADLGVPGSASDGLIALGSHGVAGTVVDVWAIAPLGGEADRPRLLSHVDLAHGLEDTVYIASNHQEVLNLLFSPDGSKLAATASDCLACVLDVASLARLGVCTSFLMPEVAWAPDGKHVLLSYFGETSSWEFGLPDLPPSVVVSADADRSYIGFSRGGASYFVTRTLKGRTRHNPNMLVLEEKRAVDGSIVRTVDLGRVTGNHWEKPCVILSPDSHAALLCPPYGSTARIVVLG